MAAEVTDAAVTGGRPPVVLIGPMGAGKTRIGKRVARLLGTGFQDTDKLIVAEHGAIAELFDAHGEPHFRAIERDMVARALASDDVVALGGGAILAAETQQLLANHRVVLVTVTAEAVEPRITDGRRPLVRNGIREWERIYAERLPIYQRLAQFTVDTSHRPIDAAAQEVAEWSTTAV